MNIVKEAVVKKIRVCCFCERWKSGGIESFLHNVLTQMDLTNLEIDLVTAQMKESVFSQHLQAHGVIFHELSGSQENVLENHRLFQKLLRERQYDVVHLNIFHGMSLYYVHLAKLAGVPVRIAHSHNTDLRKSCARQVKLWLHRLYSNRYAADATAFWACSENAAKFMFPEELLEKKNFTFIPNGIETAKFRFDPAGRERIRQELGITGQFVIGNVGRLCYQKNQSFLLDVFDAVARLRPESRLLLVGEGEDLNTLREKAGSLGVADRVIFYGTTAHPERLLWAMDAFAFPSRFEGLGIAAIEAQAAGLPVVCSEHVPEETEATPLVHRIPLGDGPAVWAKTLLAVSARERELGVEQVRRSGFDIADVVRFVKNCYMG